MTVHNVGLPITYSAFTLIVDGEFEPLEITPYSTPPELPDVMKSQDQAHVSNASGENPA